MFLRFCFLISLITLISGRFIIFNYYNDGECSSFKQTGFADADKCYVETFTDLFQANSTHFQWSLFPNATNCNGTARPMVGPLNACTNHPWGMPIRVIVSDSKPPLHGMGVAQMFASKSSCERGESGRYNLFKQSFCTGDTAPSILTLRRDNHVAMVKMSERNCKGTILETRLVRSGECTTHPTNPRAWVRIDLH